jgi:hypothetical protein
MGNSRWRRLTEERAGSAKSVFHFDVQGSVAKSTHAGIPWLFVSFRTQRLIASMRAIGRMTLFAGINAAAAILH